MTSRGTTKAELNLTRSRLLAGVKARVDSSYVPTFRCPGGCEDTGWVTVDDGLVDSRRVKAPTERRCDKCNGRPPKPVSQARAREFS